MGQADWAAVLFDHDGTLVDSEAVHFACWVSILAPMGVTLSREEYRRFFVGVPSKACVPGIIQRHGLDIAPDALLKRKEDAVDAWLAEGPFPLMTRALETLEQLHAAGFRIGIVTGAMPAGVQSSLRAYRLQRWVEVVVTAADVLHSKPAPDVYLKAAELLGLPPDRCVAVEDTHHGLSAAVAAGMACVAVPNEDSAQQDFSAASTLVSNGLLDAAAWIGERAKPLPART